MTGTREGGRAWTYEEHLLAMNLYCKLPFGRLHKGAPEIIELARMLKRTPSSVSMKLCNFASLDPQLQARGIKGLSGVSSDAKTVWNEFHQDWDRLADQSEALRESLKPTAAKLDEKQPREYDWSKEPNGPSERTQMVRVRRTQRFFRLMILASYNYQCCVTSISIPELLIASHILPWSGYPEHRTNPKNGLCLSRLYDSAFDSGLLTFDEDYRLVLSKNIKEHYTCEAVKSHFDPYEGKCLNLPDKFTPDPAFITHHRESCFHDS